MPPPPPLCFALPTYVMCVSVGELHFHFSKFLSYLLLSFSTQSIVFPSCLSVNSIQ